MLRQIKPLTEEEKKQKLADLREKMAAKRAVKAKEEAKEARANEAIRRKSGKVSSGFANASTNTDVVPPGRQCSS